MKSENSCDGDVLFSNFGANVFNKSLHLFDIESHCCQGAKIEILKIYVYLLYLEKNVKKKKKKRNK